MTKLLRITKSSNQSKKWDAIFMIDGKEKKVSFGASGYRDNTLINDKNSKFYFAFSKIFKSFLNHFWTFFNKFRVIVESFAQYLSNFQAILKPPRTMFEECLSFFEQSLRHYFANFNHLFLKCVPGRPTVSNMFKTSALDANSFDHFEIVWTTRPNILKMFETIGRRAQQFKTRFETLG